jgi:hypothetical protein
MGAKAITRTGGRGEASDIDVVVAELEKWPADTIQALAAQDTKVVVCRGSITDYRTDLKGVKPRGWPPGSSWDTVPGVCTADRNEVVIAVRGHAEGNPHVPKTGEGHGSFNLVVHESGHAVDLCTGDVSRSKQAAFQAARNKDLATLSAYESQADPAGTEETWAESAARYYAGDAGDGAAHPNLHAFWDSRTVGPMCSND